MPRISWKIVVPSIVAALLFGFGMFALGYETARAEMRAALAGRLQASSVPTPKPATPVVAGVTIDQFRQVQEGMTFEQVQAILGEPHEVGMHSESSNIGTMTSYRWEGDPKGSASVTFSNGYVYSTNWMQF